MALQAITLAKSMNTPLESRKSERIDLFKLYVYVNYSCIFLFINTNGTILKQDYLQG